MPPIWAQTLAWPVGESHCADMVWIPGFGRYSAKRGNRVGDAAPDFVLPDQDGRDVKLSEQWAEQPVVLVFYPRANSPICTRQMCSLRDNWGELTAKAKVFGLSYDDPAQLMKFKQAQNLPFDLLSDPDKRVAKLYGVSGMLAAARVTFVIGTDGRIKAVIDSILADEHHKQVLAAL